MTISSCYVWKWLPGATEPVVAGELRFDREGRQTFAYGRSYLERENAEPIYAPELNLRRGTQEPIRGLNHFSCLRDAAPDAWGRRVIHARLLGKKNADPAATLEEGVYLLNSGSDRVGALDFQESASNYVSRDQDAASLADLGNAAELLASGSPIPADLDAALFHGSTIGGARPKAAITADHGKSIAKFSVSTDSYNMVQAEYVAMALAGRAGLDVAQVSLGTAGNKDVLLVKRFDRVRDQDTRSRLSVVSALTVLGLDERWAGEASYPDLADQVRIQGIRFKDDARELFSRMMFNVLIGNTDDHAKNQAFFIEGERIRLTPAYDITPFPRAGGEAGHGMKIYEQSNLSRIDLCIAAAGEFGVTSDEARTIASNQIRVIAHQFDAICEEIAMDPATRRILWRRSVLNPDVFSGGFEELNPSDR